MIKKTVKIEDELYYQKKEGEHFLKKKILPFRRELDVIMEEANKAENKNYRVFDRVRRYSQENHMEKYYVELEFKDETPPPPGGIFKEVEKGEHSFSLKSFHTVTYLDIYFEEVN